jgi:hypothetical protein
MLLIRPSVFPWGGCGSELLVRRSILLFCAALPLLTSCGGDGGTDPVPPPPALSTVSATASSHTEVLLTWTAPAGGARVSELRIERATGTGSFTEVATVPGDATSYRDVGLTPGTVYQYRVRACGEGGCSDFTTTTVTTHALLVITTTSLPDAIRGEPYNAGLNAEGGGAGYVWTLASGSLPAGLTLRELGVVSGIPETVQTAVFVARVRSDDGQTATRELTLRVVEPPAGTGLAITTSRLAPGLVAGAYGVTLAATGGDGSYAWTVVSGSLPAGVSLGTGGQFSGAPTTAGSATFTVRVTSGGRSAEQTFTLVVVPDDTSRFDLTPFEVATVPDAIRPHLLAAIARWERVISGDLGALQTPQRFFSATDCGGFGALVNGASTDDVIVMLDISPIDGPAKILGQAGPCGLRNDRLPFVGVLTLDSEDLAPMVGTQNLTDVIFHEIGHILGYGTIWNSSVLTGGGTSDPRLTGARAVQEYAALGGTGSVPVENTGGAGTADAHWRESTFRTEVMTGFSERLGVAMPLSRVSIASMADLGYTVSFAEANPYSLPSALAAPPLTTQPLGWDVILPGPVRTLPSEPRP